MPLRVPSRRGIGLEPGRVQDERLRLEVAQLVLGRVDEHRPREERVVRVARDDADGDPVRRVGARERVDDVERRWPPRCAATFSRSPSKCSSEISALTSPHQIRSSEPGSRTMNLSFGERPGVLAGVDRERPALGEPALTARQSIGVELRRRGVPVDGPRGLDPVLLRGALP